MKRITLTRRASLQWMLAAAALPGLAEAAPAPSGRSGTSAQDAGYGTDPDLVRSYRSGQLWPLTMTAAQRETARVLCNLIIPADERSPGAGDVDVHLFIDEWISAPYPTHRLDRERIVQGLAWLDATAQQRWQCSFTQATPQQQQALCSEVSYLPRAAPEQEAAARFFARFRDLTAGGFYTTPQGTQDLQFAGNRPSATFDGPPPDALKIVGVS